MVIYFKVDGNGHLDGWQSNPSKNNDDFSVEVADDHEVLTNPEIFKYENGELIKDTAYQQQLKDEVQAQQNQPTDDEINAMAIMELTEKIMGGK